MDKAFLTKKPPAELIISWSDKTETRYVRPAARDDAADRKGAHSNEMEDEDYRVVMECAPYTASFNHLLSERRANENPRRFASLVHERMRSDAVPMNTDTYNFLMGRLVRFTDGSIFDLYEQLKVEGTKESCSVQPNKETFALLFRACERNAEYQRAFLLYQQMRDTFHLSPDTATYNTLLGFCAAVKDVAQACYFMEEMKANATSMDTNTYNCFMSVLVDTAPYAETLAIFNRMCEEGSQPTLRTYNTLLKAMRAHGDFDKGFQVYEEMKKKGHIPDIVTYNTLLWLCEDRLDYVLGEGKYSHVLRSQEQKSTGMNAVANLALTLLAEMQAVKVEANTFSYNKVLHVLLRCEDPRIFAIYHKVEQACRSAVENSSPGGGAAKKRASLSFCSQSSAAATSVSVRTDSHSQAGKAALSSMEVQTAPLEDVRKTLEDAMREEDPTDEGCIRALTVRPNIETEKLIMRAFVLFEQPEKCKPLHLANRKLYAHFKLTQELALVLLEAAEKTGDQAWAETLLQEAIAEKLVVDTTLFNAYLAVLSAVASPSLLEHFEVMKLGIHQRGPSANTQTFNIVMRGYLRQKEAEKGLAVFADMISAYATSRVSELVPDDDTFSLVVQLYDQQENSSGAEAVIESALKKSHTMGISVFHHLLRLFGHSKDARAVTWFDRLRGDDTQAALPKVDAECYAIVMAYHLSDQRYEQVARLFNELKTSQTLEPSTAVYRVLFDMYREQANRTAMIAVFDDARVNSVRLDVDMYNSVLATFVEAKDPFVFEVLSEMRENSIPPADTTIAIFLATPSGRKQLAEAVTHKLFYKTTSNAYM